MRASGKVSSLDAWRECVVCLSLFFKLRCVDFPNPILTCIDCVGLHVSSSFLSGYEKNGNCRASSRFCGKCMLHSSSEGWHARCSHQFIRETAYKSHQASEGGLSHDGYRRKAYCNLKPTHILLALHRSSGLNAPMGRGPPPPRKSLTSSVGVWGQYRPMYGECISCALQSALFRILTRWDLKLPDNLFIACHEPWHISGLGQSIISKPSLGTLPQFMLSSVEID